MIYHYITDDYGTILAVYDDSEAGIKLADKQGRQLARYFPDSQIYLHSVFTTSRLEPGMSSSMKGRKLRFYANGETAYC